MGPTSPASSAFLVIASLAVHAAAFTALGHGRAAATQLALADAVVGIEVTETPAPIPIEEETPVAPERAAVAPAGHHHDYPVPDDHDAHPHDPSLVHAPLPALAAAPAAPATTPEPAAAAEPEPVRFAMAVSNLGGGHATTAAGTGSAVGSAHGDPHGAGADGEGGAPLAESGVSSPARALHAITPAYPAGARSDGVEADVVLQIVVSPSGEVRSAEVTRPAGYGFDAEALRAVKTARFAPAQKDGRAVAVRMRWTISFRLR